MRSLVMFVVMMGLWLFPDEAKAQAVWVQPAPMFLLGPSLKESLANFQLRSLSAGANIPVLGKELVVELQLAPGAAQGGCGKTWFWGGWAAVGVLFPLGHSATDGLFIQPKITGSYFDQSREADSCVDATNVRWASGEFGLGVDVGFQATLGPLYVAPVIGAYLAECINCPANSTPLASYSPYLAQAVGERFSHVSFGFNLNLLRIGMVF